MKVPIRTTFQQTQTAVQGDGTGLQRLKHSTIDMEPSAMSLNLQRDLSSSASIQTPPLTHWHNDGHRFIQHSVCVECHCVGGVDEMPPPDVRCHAVAQQSCRKRS